MSEHPPYRPIRRIRQACRNCRRKKARCPGERPECTFCSRLGQTCTYSDDETSVQSSAVSSTSATRARKVQYRLSRDGNKDNLSDRLSALENQVAGVVDAVKGFETALKTLSTQLTKALSNGVQDVAATAGPQGQEGDITVPTQAYNRLPPMDIIQSAANLYFRYCHNQPYSLFHEASFRSKVELNEVPTHLLFALLASTVRYSSDPFFADKNAAVAAYANQSWRAIVMPWNGIQSDAELSIVQTILLLAIIDYTDGRTQASWIKVGLAIRLCQDFRMMVEPDKSLSAPQQEERRRVFWSFYLCDKLISCGRERPATVLDTQCKLQLPGDENDWRAGCYQQTPTLDVAVNDGSGINPRSSLSPFAITVVVASLLGRSAQYALGEEEAQTAAGKLPPWNPTSKYSAIHSAVLQLESELGLNEAVSGKIAQFCLAPDGSIDQHRAAPLAFAHALFYLCQCLLYHPFLLKQRLSEVTQRTPQRFLDQTSASCRLAATSLSQLLGDVKSLHCPTLTTSYDPFYGYCNMVAGVIHSMYLTAGDPTDREMAARSFDLSMQNLKELSYYWKSCDMMHARLEDFRANSERYAALVDPTVQDVDLSPDDATDLIECLDYARMSTTGRRRSQSATDHAAFSQLPSPFFEELVSLLPLSYSRPVSPPPFADIFGQPGAAAFDAGMAAQGPGANLYDMHSEIRSSTATEYPTEVGQFR